MYYQVRYIGVQVAMTQSLQTESLWSNQSGFNFQMYEL